MAKRLLIGLALVLAAAGMVVYIWAVAVGPLRNPNATLQDFYSGDDRAEDQLMDPLILNGRGVVPLVIAALPDKDMPNRRYAIRFLGNGHYLDALPVLEGILADPSEEYYLRSDALDAIYMISPTRARSLAAAHVDGPDLLGQQARAIVSGHGLLNIVTRTYWQALWSDHE